MQQSWEKEKERRKKEEYQDWLECYKEHLHSLYDMFSEFTPLSYESFCQLAYEHTQYTYCYREKRFKKFLIYING